MGDDGLNALFDVYAPDDSLLGSGDSGGRPVVVDPLPADGDYLVVVQSVRGGAGFDLTVEITSPSGSAPVAATSCATYTEFNGDDPMRLCHKGALVRDVQQALVDLGDDVDVDGFFGPGTARALEDYLDDGVAELMPPDIEALTFDEDPSGSKPWESAALRRPWSRSPGLVTPRRVWVGRVAIGQLGFRAAGTVVEQGDGIR